MATVTISRGIRDGSSNPAGNLPATIAPSTGRSLNPNAASNLPARIIGDVATTLPNHPKAIIVAQGGSPFFVLPLAPVTTDADGYALNYSTVDRPGKKPLVIANGMPAQTLSFTAVLRWPDRNGTSQSSIEDEVLKPLKALAAARTQFAIERMGFTERGWWRLTGLKISPTARQHGTNHVTRANATFSFIEAVNFAASVGPLTGGAQAPAAIPAPSTGPAVPERYAISRGDTLQKVSSRFYGTPNRWQDIARASGIVNANLVYPGQVVTIPRP